MMDFSQINDPAGWASAAQRLIAKARDAVSAQNVNRMKAASSDLLAFVQQRTSDCPQTVVDSVVAAQTEVVLAIEAGAVGAIDAATTQLSAILIDVQRVSADLNRQAKMIELQPVLDTLDSVTSVINDVKAIQAKIEGQDLATLDVGSLKDGVQDILDQLTGIARNLRILTG
jgi:hypothetical protein